MKYHITHITDYVYQSPSSLCHNMMVQTPRDLDFQQVEHFEQIIEPAPQHLHKSKDFFDNERVYFSIEKTHSKLTITSKSIVTIETPSWMNVDPGQTQSWEEVQQWLQTTEAMNDIRQFYLQSKHVDFPNGIQEYAIESFTPGRPIMEAMLELNHRIHEDFTFTPGFTDISTPISEVFANKKGVCQDYAHFTIACLRSIGLAARYVSGYLETLPPPGKPKMVGADASHAWIALYIPGLDWVEFDATNDLLVGDQHVRVAFGRDFADVTPLKGIIFSSGNQVMKVSVDVRRPEELIQ
ncbi:MAG: transglutaminase [Flammeovirgaceae bacterium]|nr:transglutaminase [Flammeovirgaceae bacterium]MBR10839.1 transglutaminase [Rickettsiales bacterium]HCX20354.1 transglutaminase family protein [Cytophagales bacterium]|tara:strand:- start:1119 stop:2006 length:888 start_codon:yes stop_codon:yes gene_type:complete